jgi:hypothetical protein
VLERAREGLIRWSWRRIGLDGPDRERMLQADPKRAARVTRTAACVLLGGLASIASTYATVRAAAVPAIPSLAIALVMAWSIYVLVGFLLAQRVAAVHARPDDEGANLPAHIVRCVLVGAVGLLVSQPLAVSASLALRMPSGAGRPPSMLSALQAVAPWDPVRVLVTLAVMALYAMPLARRVTPFGNGAPRRAADDAVAEEGAAWTHPHRALVTEAHARHRRAYEAALRASTSRDVRYPDFWVDPPFNTTLRPRYRPAQPPGALLAWAREIGLMPPSHELPDDDAASGQAGTAGTRAGTV